MPINASPYFEHAQREYEQAQTTEQKIKYLKKMIALAPKHKGAENLNAQLRRRLAKLKYTKEKESRSGKSTFKGIKKEDMQAVIVGFTNSGKSTLLSKLTNTSPEIADYDFTTKSPLLGMINFEGVNIQLIEIPSIGSEYYNKGIVHTADTIIIVVKKMGDISKIEEQIGSTKKIIVFNLTEHQDNERKISATLKSKKYDFVILDLKNPSILSLNELKEKIFQSFGKIRVFTKEPGQKKHSNQPIVLNSGANVKDVAEKILHGFSNKVKETTITGPSSKFPNQKVGMKHILKDMDVIEFRTR